jgi:hypothetical protein
MCAYVLVWRTGDVLPYCAASPACAAGLHSMRSGHLGYRSALQQAPRQPGFSRYCTVFVRCSSSWAAGAAGRRLAGQHLLLHVATRALHGALICTNARISQRNNNPRSRPLPL